MKCANERKKEDGTFQREFRCLRVDFGRWLMFQIRSLGFALILIGVNYLIFKERELGEKASEVEKYMNEAVEMR